MTFAEWQVGQVVWSMLWFTLFFFWIYTVIMVFSDIFRSRDLGGGAKVVWTLFVIFLPFLGVLSYLVARGAKMGEHAMQDARAHDDAFRAYIRDAVAEPAGPSDDLATLERLRQRGIIDDAELASMKARVGA